MYKEVFPGRLREARIECGLKQSDIAEAAGINRTDITKFENGDKEPKLEALGKIADCLNVSVDWLIGHTSKSI